MQATSRWVDGGLHKGRISTNSFQIAFIWIDQAVTPAPRVQVVIIARNNLTWFMIFYL